MKNFILVAVAALMAASCEKSGQDLPPAPCGPDSVGHDMIELGQKLDNPYKLDNVKAALQALYPTKAGRIDVSPTNLYVRFLPRDQAEFDVLTSLGVEMVDHPVDYEIIKDGDYYHDPSIDSDSITWQYAVLDKDFVFPSGIIYEVLDECYIKDGAATRASDGIDWDAVERKSYEMTGNSDLLAEMTKGGSSSPEGRVTIVDEKANGGKPFGVAGAQVVVNSFVKIGKAYTDRDGYYKINKSYSSKIRYRLVFKNTKGFRIGFNMILVPASFSTFGKGEPSGLDARIDASSNRKLFCRCVVNNAAYDYYERCASTDMNISLPPSDLRFWIFQNIDESSAVMLRHGAIVSSNKLLQLYLGTYMGLIKKFLPDITIGAKSKASYSDLYSATIHELAHASHFAQAGTSYWDKYIMYILESWASGGNCYGSASDKNSGYCEVGEMWAYHVETMMYYERYGGNLPNFGTSWWFYPQIFRNLEDRGLSRSQIFSALSSDVTSLDLLKTRLGTLYPTSKTTIDQVFNRYAR